ncbi:uncharacterized protein LOC132824311 [Hemiscyllium ocellatum]|uniref:uncharacterized protein LOC132824311 n=1 Tax=Hemiscyllium ocellatum TaxID=170820 RepID=UPI002966A46C|nr:uncharacterized protein LOC132824311 [Hemiscyllium ocellatum]
MIYQLLDLSAQLSPPVQRPLETSHLTPVWPWTSRTLRQRTLSSYLRSSSRTKASVTESVEETVTIKSNPLTFQVVTTPQMNRNTAMDATTSRATLTPQLSLYSETYKTWRTSELLMSSPPNGGMVVIHRPKASSASPLASSDDMKATPLNPSPPATVHDALRTLIDSDSEVAETTPVTVHLWSTPSTANFTETANTINQSTASNVSFQTALKTGHPSTCHPGRQYPVCPM